MWIVWIIIKALLALAIGLVHILVFLYAERKLLADMQVRMGPMRVGKHGILQPVADALKLLIKEDIIPKGADKLLFVVAPIIVFAPSFMIYMVIPLSSRFVAHDMGTGIFYIFGVLTVLPVGILLAGWSSFSKYSLLGGLRAAAQQISYEIPLLISILGIIMLSGSFSLVSVVGAQKGSFLHLGSVGLLPRWFIFLQPLAFILFFVTMLADQVRTPFDLPEAESEIVQGYMTEYSSMKFAIFFLAEYSNVVILSTIAALAFLGGWHGPFGPSVFWLALKVYFLIFVVIWLRATLPRVRIDQLMDLGWKILLPLGLLNVVVTGFLMLQ